MFMFLDIPCIYVIHNNRTFSAAGLWFFPDTPGLFDVYLIFTLLFTTTLDSRQVN